MNSIDTTTKGLDLTLSHNTKPPAPSSPPTWRRTSARPKSLVSIAPALLRGYEDVLLSERERLFIEQGGPSRKANTGL